MEGSELASYPSLGEMTLRTYGLINPARTVAEECIPGEPEKKSIMPPVKKDKRSRSHAGVSTGRSIMNII